MTGFTSKRKMAQDKALSRPVEADYTSQVAYTRALEAYCDGLAQPVQKPVQGPVAWMYTSRFAGNQKYITWFQHDLTTYKADKVWALYTAPPTAQRPWVGLTDEKIQAIHDTYHKRMGPQEFARAIEAALKEKNFD